MIQENIRLDLLTMVPASIFKEISCFAFFDNHPRSIRKIDVLFCTQHGEVVEYYKRERLSSLLLKTSKNFKEIRIFRNINCDLFYFIATEDELFILSCKDKLILEHTVNDVESYEVNDSLCSGQASLKIIRKDDAIPLYFDDNFKALNERCINFEKVQSEDQTPILMQLMRKLTEAKYNLQCNENKYKEFVHLRQVATFYLYQKMCPNLTDSLFNINSQEIASKMLLKTWTPWIKFCNKKMVIGFNMANEDSIVLEEVYVLLNSSLNRSIVYSTSLFEFDETHWIEKEDQSISAKTEVSVVTTVDLCELQNNVTSRIEFDMVLALNKCGKDYLLPFEEVYIAASDIMGTDFDVLANPCDTDEKQILLSVLATSKKTELCLRRIKNAGDESFITEADVFCKYLKMEMLQMIKGVAIHKVSPFHILHGVLVIFDKNETSSTNGKFIVQVHTRCPSQVLSLIHFINDAVPFRIIATTSNCKITSNTEQLSHYDEEMPLVSQEKNYLNCGSSILNQTTMLLEYLDKCMIKMNESKDPSIQRKIGNEIDVIACGIDEFIDLRNKLINEVYSQTGIHKHLNPDPDLEIPVSVKEDSVEMLIDE